MPAKLPHPVCPAPHPLRALLSHDATLFRHTRRLFSEKRFVELDGNRLVLVRDLVPGAARRARALLSIAEAGGVPVQRGIDLSASFTLYPFGWWRAFRFESGETWHRAPPTVIATRRLAIGLARLHRLRPPVGLFDRSRPEALVRTVVAQATAAIQNSTRLSSEERLALLEFVDRQSDRLIPAEGSSLVHGDLHGLNIIVAPRGQVFFIDTERMGAGLPLLELAHALLNLFVKRNANLKAVFLRDYLLRLSPAGRRAWRQNAPALLMFARLVMAWRRHRRSLVLQRRGDHTGAAEAAHFQERFLGESLLHLYRLQRAAEKHGITQAQELQTTTRKSAATGA